MAETEEGSGGGGGKLGKMTGILNKKFAGMPVWLISVVIIVILIYVIKKRQDAKAAAGSADNTGSLAADIANQAFPYAAPMNFSSDVFVNNQLPGPPAPPASSGGGTTSPMQHYVTFQKGTSVVDTITNLQKQGVSTTYDQLVKLNKGLNSAITWDPVNLPNSPSHKRLDTWGQTVELRLDNSVPDKTVGGH